jgi:hypothetical protein
MKLMQMALKGCGVLMVLAVVAAPVLAQADNYRHHGTAPEIDPGSMVGALTLLSCGLMMITDRFRRK